MLSIIQKLMLGFVTLIIGLVLIGSVAVSTGGATSLISVTDNFNLVKVGATTANNVTYDYPISSLSDAWRQDISECSLDTLGTVSNILVYNSSGSEMMNNGACVGATNEFYYVETEDTLHLCNVPNMNSSTTAYITYNTCPVDYVSGWGGTVLNLIPGFFALALLIFSVGMFYSVARETGII